MTPDPCGASSATAEASRTEGAVTHGDDCPTCEGYGEVGICANDGTHGCSHINDNEFPCPDCGGTGEIPSTPLEGS